MRSWHGMLIHLLVMTGAFGLFLAGAGSSVVAAALSVTFMILATITSNAKRVMLGEPLLFSDLALISSAFRHPRFYLTAISVGQRRILVIGAPLLLIALASLFVPRVAFHLEGLGLVAIAVCALLVLLRSKTVARLARQPDVEADLARHGLIATTLLYWLRWRDTRDPPPIESNETVLDQPGALMPPPELIVIVQCESFADPVALTDQPDHALIGLTAARHAAWQWGKLDVSGFGAYTMRTEYGVLFGRSEDALGFRRYDPFLTAHGEKSYALSSRLGGHGYHCLFVHPHDMRFYGRDRLMPAIGFARMIGEENFAGARTGRYVDDVTLGAAIECLVDEAAGPTLIYAVTMENHGPWDKERLSASSGAFDAYLRHVGSSDAMLTALINRLTRAGRSALLVFFGDHRPSIPGVATPGGPRDTPYVLLRFASDGQIATGQNHQIDLTPDELHHAILRCVIPVEAGIGSTDADALRVRLR